MLLDLVVSVLAAGSWLAAGAVHGRRLLLMVAVCLSAARVGTVGLLAGSGWWFVQEKVTLTLPLLLAGAAVALVRRRPVWFFTAGYAAAAGPFVTLLHGYPSTWPVALITVAVVGGACLLTAVVLGERRLRAAAVASGTALLLGIVLALIAGPAPSPVDGVSVASLRGPSTGDIVRRYTLDAHRATITLPSGATLQAWTFNGQVPGPPLTAEVGDVVEVTLHNTDIAAGVTLHW